MQREPIGLYLFRFVMGLGLFAFMCMLYWSSVLIEERLQEVRSDLSEIEESISELKVQNQQLREEFLRGAPSVRENASARSQKNEEYPNLLEKDLFYEATLPKMLGPDFRAHGKFRDATVGQPDNLHPFSNWSNVAAWRSQCGLTLARLKFGKYETMAPYMAVKIEERPRKNSPLKEFWVHLRDNVFWQPLESRMFSGGVRLAPHFLTRHPVTAHDFKFFFDAMMNPAVEAAGAVSLRSYFGDVEEIEVIDDLTFVVRWKGGKARQPDGSFVEKIKYSARQLTGELQPLASFVYQYFADGSKIILDDKDPETYRTNPVWAQNFNDHWAKNVIVSCGAWIFDGASDRQIGFQRNPDHFFPLDALLSSQEVAFRNSPDSIWQDFKSERVDTYSLRPDQLIEYQEFLESKSYKEQKSLVKRLDFLARTYSYIGWNMAKPYFRSEKVRRAMTMAIDRERIIEQILNGLGVEITGPFFKNSPSYDPNITAWPFDTHAAKRLLEEAGWYDSDGDGIRDKIIDGKRVPFSFRLTYYVKNQTTKAVSEYVATALKEIGVECLLHGVDIADLSAAFDDKSFDAISLGWALGTPPEDPSQLWHSKWAKVKGSSNAVGFANAEADRIIEDLQFEDNAERRQALYFRFHEIIHKEQPYTFLFSPKTVFLYRDYVQNVFIPEERQDLIPGANVAEPVSSIFWLKKE